MFKSILPKEYNFYDYFEKHIAISKSISELLIQLSDGKIELEACAKQIREMENQADKITHECTEALHKTFITPIERTDIFTLIKRLDDIADNMESAVSRMSLYEVKEIRPETREVADILVSQINALEIAIKGLRNIKNGDAIKEQCIRVRELESIGDKAFRRGLQRLFRETDAVVIIKWKEILERFEKAIDRCEDVANVIESVLIDNA